MKKVDLTKYTDFIVEKTVELLNIDSPTGYTTNAAKWVKENFEALGYEAKFTNKGECSLTSAEKMRKMA